MLTPLTSGRPVLVVDTSMSDCDLLIQFLTNNRIPTRAAATGASALQMIRTQDFRAVIAEFHLPDMIGLDLLCSVRMDLCSPIPVILTAAAGIPLSTVVRAIKCGADDLLEKPLTIDAVAPLVARLSCIPPTCVYDDRISHLLEIIQSRYWDVTITSTSLSREIGVCREHMSRLVKRDLGTTPSRLLTTVRLTHARRLLASPTLLVKEVAAKTGFHSTHDLDRHFRRHCGISPADYRRRNVLVCRHAR